MTAAIKTYPVMGWSTQTLKGGNVLVQLACAHSEQDVLQNTPQFLPVTISASKLRELAASLLLAAEAAEMGQAPTSTAQ